MGGHAVSLEVRVTNWGAQRMYGRFGFRPAGIRRNYYQELHEDALIMWTDDIRTESYAARLARDRSDDARPGALHVIVLGIETSCDETAVAVVEDGFVLRANLIASQVQLHERFGGVVPEVAARAHVETLNPLLDEALTEADVGFDEIDAVAVTTGPGLVGALLVGMAGAKAVSLATGADLVGVNHLEGHYWANFLEHGPPDPPYVALIVSGGHTMLVHVPEMFRHVVLGQTLDDAAGEAFDKIARLIGLGFPGGPALDAMARDGEPRRDPVPARDGGLRRLRLLDERAEDRGAAPRPGGAGVRRGSAPARISRRASRRRSSTCRSPRRSRPPRTSAHRRSCSAAASSPTPACANDSPRRATGRGSACSSRRCRCAPTTPR